MRYAKFNNAGRIELSVNDETLEDEESLPVGAVVLTKDQWDQRFDLLLVNGSLTISPIAQSTERFKTKFTSLEFLDRFSTDEQLAVVAATMENTPIKLWYDRLLAASYIDLSDPRTEEGIDALISSSLIAEDRKSALMSPELLLD